MTSDPIYSESVTSNKTEALFVALAILFFLPFAWQARDGVIGPLGVLFFCLFAVFLFYVLNYRTLIFRLNKAAKPWAPADGPRGPL